LFDDLQREPAGVFCVVKSVIVVGLTALIAASASLADTPVKGSQDRKEKVTEQTVFVTGSLIPQRIKVHHVGTTTVSPISVVNRAAIDATGRQTAAGFLVNEPSVRIIGH
jgi:outer membrane cobalamin receptor